MILMEMFVLACRLLQIMQHLRRHPTLLLRSPHLLLSLPATGSLAGISGVHSAPNDLLQTAYTNLLYLTAMSAINQYCSAQ